MKIRTKNIVVGANKFRNLDCKIVATMYDFDLVNLTFRLRYDYEIPTTITGPEGEEQTIFNYEVVHDFRNQTISVEEINQLFVTMGVDLNLNNEFAQNIIGAMHEGFRLKVGLDGRFGLTADDWELI
jgi:hypothetical protein